MPETTFLHIRGRGAVAARVLELPGVSVRIGRGAQCEVRLKEPALAEVQCLLRRRGKTWHIQPVGPPGPLSIEGRQVDHQRPLVPGVPLRVGDHWLMIRSAGAEPSAFGTFDAPIPIAETDAPTPGPEAAPEPVAEVPSTSPASDPNPDPDPTPAAELPVNGADLDGEQDRLRRWQSSLEQRERWLLARQEERKWEARWRAAGERLRARAAGARPRTVTTAVPEPRPAPRPPIAEPSAHRLPPRPAPRPAPTPTAPGRIDRPIAPAPVVSRPVPGPEPRIEPTPPDARPSTINPVVPKPAPEQPTRSAGTSTIAEVPAEITQDVAGAIAIEPMPPVVTLTAELDPSGSEPPVASQADTSAPDVGFDPGFTTDTWSSVPGDHREANPLAVGDLGPIAEPPGAIDTAAVAPAPIEPGPPVAPAPSADAPAQGPAGTPAELVGSKAPPPEYPPGPPAPEREAELEAARWPSVRIILQAQRTAPATAPPPRSNPTRQPVPTRAVPRPEPTPAVAPATWSIPIGAAWVAVTMLALFGGFGGIALSWTWARDDRVAGALADRYLKRTTLPERDEAPELDWAPRTSWWASTPGHLYLRALAASRSEQDAGRPEDVRMFLEAARVAAPLHPAVLYGLARRPRGEGQEAEPARGLGLSRDVLTLAWTGRMLLEAGKLDDAARVYAASIAMAAADDPIHAPLPAFDEAGTRRFLLPGEDLIGRVVREMVEHAAWSFERWSAALGDSAVARLAAYRALHDRGAADAERALDQILAHTPETELGPPAGVAEALRAAVEAEALAFRGRFDEARDRYAAAIAAMPDSAIRRTWWVNLAEVHARLGDAVATRDAWEAARAANPHDEIGKRVAELQGRALVGAGRAKDRGRRGRDRDD